MTTPKKSEIIQKAVELWKLDQYRSGCSELAENNPEYSELLESGYVSQARNECMRNQHKSEIESQYIDYPQDFSVDIKGLFKYNGLILGGRGSGKSDVGMLVAEKCMKADAIVICFDPSIDWLERSNVPRLVTVDSTDLTIPYESTIFDLGLSTVLNQQEAVEDFNKKLFETQARITHDRKQFLVIFEEAHTYFYQGCMRAKALQNSVRLLSVGRNVDIAVVLISQFASMLDKFAIKHSLSQSWYSRTFEPNDIRYLRQILGEQAENLKKLNAGEFIYMNRNKLSKIGINPYENAVIKNKPIRVVDMIYNENDLTYTVNVETHKQDKKWSLW